MKKVLLSTLLLALCSFVLSKENPLPDQGFIDVPGGPVWYRVAGDGTGIPLLVLHGGPGGTSCGYALLEPLGDMRTGPRMARTRGWGFHNRHAGIQ